MQLGMVLAERVVCEKWVFFCVDLIEKLVQLSILLIKNIDTNKQISRVGPNITRSLIYGFTLSFAFSERGLAVEV